MTIADRLPPVRNCWLSVLINRFAGDLHLRFKIGLHTRSTSPILRLSLRRSINSPIRITVLADKGSRDMNAFIAYDVTITDKSFAEKISLSAVHTSQACATPADTVVSTRRV